jgi:hypothetical protein
MWSMLRIRIEITQPRLNGQDLDDFLSVRDVKRRCPKRREAYFTPRVLTEETTISILAESAYIITKS